MAKCPSWPFWRRLEVIKQRDTTPELPQRGASHVFTSNTENLRFASSRVNRGSLNARPSLGLSGRLGILMAVIEHSVPDTALNTVNELTHLALIITPRGTC